LAKSFFIKRKKSEKVFGKLTLGKSEFAEREILRFHSSDKLGICKKTIIVS
jgi:hypothetical protein